MIALQSAHLSKTRWPHGPDATRAYGLVRTGNMGLQMEIGEPK